MRTCILISLLLTACASPEKDPMPQTVKAPSASIEAKQVALSVGTQYVGEVVFSQGSSRLSPHGRERLQSVLKSARTKGDIEKHLLITWGDQEYPSVHTESLPTDDIHLADQRAKRMREGLKLDGKAEVEIINMAKRPGWLQELVDSRDANIKRALEIAGIPNTDTSVKSPSKAAHGILIVLLKDQ